MSSSDPIVKLTSHWDGTFVLDSRYTDVHGIGRGASGLVAKAYDTVLGKHVAIKRIAKIFSSTEAARAILRELVVLHHLRGHANVLNLLDCIIYPAEGDDFHTLYLVTEIWECDLHKIVGNLKQGLTDTHSAYFAYQLIRACVFIHSAGWLHRDIKPANLLVMSNCDLTIADFGCCGRIRSDAAAEVKGDDWADSGDVTAANDSGPMTEAAACTPWYRAPEMLLYQARYGSAVDMWAVGCVMAEVLSRRRFFGGNTPNSPHRSRDQLKAIIHKLHVREADIAGMPLDRYNRDGLLGLIRADEVECGERPGRDGTVKGPHGTGDVPKEGKHGKAGQGSAPPSPLVQPQAVQTDPAPAGSSVAKAVGTAPVAAAGTGTGPWAGAGPGTPSGAGPAPSPSSSSSSSSSSSAASWWHRGGKVKTAASASSASGSATGSVAGSASGPSATQPPLSPAMAAYPQSPAGSGQDLRSPGSGTSVASSTAGFAVGAAGPLQPQAAQGSTDADHGATSSYGASLSSSSASPGQGHGPSSPHGPSTTRTADPAAVSRLRAQLPQGTSGLALDLLGQLLVFDPAKRLTALQALEHPYFTQFKSLDKPPVINGPGTPRCPPDGPHRFEGDLCCRGRCVPWFETRYPSVDEMPLHEVQAEIRRICEDLRAENEGRPRTASGPGADGPGADGPDAGQPHDGAANNPGAAGSGDGGAGPGKPPRPRARAAAGQVQNGDEGGTSDGQESVAGSTDQASPGQAHATAADSFAAAAVRAGSTGTGRAGVQARHSGRPGATDARTGPGRGTTTTGTAGAPPGRAAPPPPAPGPAAVGHGHAAVTVGNAVGQPAALRPAADARYDPSGPLSGAAFFYR